MYTRLITASLWEFNQTGQEWGRRSYFLRDEATGDYRNAYSCDYVEDVGCAPNRERQSLLPYHAEIVKRLSDSGKPLDVEQYISAAQQESDNEMPLADRQEGLPVSPAPISPAGPPQHY